MNPRDFEYYAWTLRDTVPVFKIIKTNIDLKFNEFDVGTEIEYTYDSCYKKWGFVIYGELSCRFSLDMITPEMIEYVGNKKYIPYNKRT